MFQWFRTLMEIHFRRIVAPYFLWISLLSFLITGVAIWFIATNWNMNSSLNALLPDDSPAAIATRSVADRVGSGSSLFVVIDSPSKEANLKFAKAYSEKLRAMPKIALAHYHNDKTFFEKNKLLYMDKTDLAALHDRIKKKIRQRKKEANPFFVSLKSKKKKDDKLEVNDLQQKYERQMASSEYKEYLFSDDGYALIVIVRFVEDSTNMVATNNLITRVRSLAQELQPETFNKEMNVEFGGALASRQKQYKSIVDDIKSSALFTVFGMFFLLALYFRRLRAIFLVLVPLVMGVAWTLAIAFGLYGELTITTVFIFAIMLGLGIDFAIHILHGYDRARAKGMETVDALVDCAHSTGLATVVGGVTTFATFLVLSLASFKSLSQFGVVASIGVVCTLIGMLVSMPAFILLAHRIWPVKPKENHRTIFSYLLPENKLRTLLPKLAPSLLAISVVLTALAAWSASGLQFEENFYRIGKFSWPWESGFKARSPEVADTKAQSVDVGRHIRRRAEAIRASVDPKSYVRERQQKSTGSKYTSALQNKQSSNMTVMLFEDKEKASKVARHAKSEIAKAPRPSIGAFNSIYDFMPGTQKEQEERMVEIKRIKTLLDKESSLKYMKKEEKERLEELREKLDVKPVTIYELPLWAKRFFKESGPKAKKPAPGEEFAFEYLIMANARQSELDGPLARDYLKNLHEVAGTPKEQGYKLGAQAYVYTTMLSEIQADGKKMISIALVLVFLILTLAFKHPGRALLSMIPLIVGSIWMFGLCAWLKIELDFFNVIIIPALIGIGVDDGVHMYMHYRQEGKGSMPHVLQDVGSAIIMTSLTSLIGFGGLAITNYRGLQSLGQLAIAGITCALLTTLLTLPAMVALLERGSKDKE